MILALDPGKHTGWARSDGRCGTLDFSAELWGAASAQFSGWIADQISEHGVKLIAYEAMIVRSADSALGLGLVWDAIRTAHLYGLPVPRSCTPQQKLRAMGISVPKGATRTLRKQLTIDAAQACGWRCHTPHEADAVAVLTWAKEGA